MITIVIGTDDKIIMDIFRITKSKTREALLKLYFSNPNKRYYLRELERILNFPVQNIRRELLALEKTGIFRKEKTGKQLYYFLNKKSPIFNELKRIISKTIGIEAQIKKILTELSDIKVAFIFGSLAKEREDSLSDIDLMIIGRPDEDELISKITKLESRLDREINYHIFSPRDWKKKLQEKNSFLENILSQPKIFLIGNKDELSRIR